MPRTVLAKASSVSFKVVRARVSATLFLGFWVGEASDVRAVSARLWESMTLAVAVGLRDSPSLLLFGLTGVGRAGAGLKVGI